MMNRSGRYLLWGLVIIGGIGLGGCSTLSKSDRHGSTADMPPIPDNTAGQPHRNRPPSPTAVPVTKSAPAAGCPTTDAPYRVCDLSRSWRDRVCLLPGGRTCRPGGTR